MSVRDDLLARLARLHAHVDSRSRALARRHASRLKCGRGCWGCCVDGLTVFEIEAERIRMSHPELLATDRPHPEGACAFLDHEGACRIYSDRPYVCRTQGLPLRWLEGESEDQAFEMRDICPLNEVNAEPLEVLPADACWTIGPVEDRLGRLQEEWGEGDMRRVPLRRLFRRTG